MNAEYMVQMWKDSTECGRVGRYAFVLPICFFVCLFVQNITRVKVVIYERQSTQV